VGNDALILDVHDPVGGERRLSFRATPGPSLTSTRRRTFRVLGPSGVHTDQTIEVVPGMIVHVPVRLLPGVTQVKVQCLDQRDVIFPNDQRTLLLGVIRPTFGQEPGRSGVAVHR
jgi:hypothetical protein